MRQTKRAFFPIYRVEMYWPATVEGKRIINSGSASYMFKTQPSDAELREWADKVWDSYRAQAVDPGRPVIEWRFVRWDSWCLTWFSHFTWDVGQSDAEVLASFEEYVSRQMRERDEPVLMGAENRWRWSGKPEDGRPPCRCDGCKQCGMIRICH